jgi:hypothetical protein
MIIVRFKETFRERMPEWVQAAGMLLWGLMTLCSPDLFIHGHFFQPLLQIMPQVAWGASAAIIGSVRLIFLVINGAYRPSAHIRAVGCVLGCLLWGNLLISTLALDWLTPATSIYTMLLGLDFLSLWFSAGDAKLADLTAKSNIRDK